MKNSSNVVKKKDPPLIDSDHSDSVGLLKTGVFSFLLHIVLVGFLIFSLKTETTKSRPLVYRVTIKPLSLQNNANPPLPQALPAPQPAPPQPPMRKEENRLKEEAKKIEPIKEEVKESKPAEEQKQLPQPQVDEHMIQKPIPLPMAETSTLSTDSPLEKEETLPTPTAPSAVETNKIASSETNVGDGTGTGTGTGNGTGGSIPGGSAEGEGAGREGSRWGGGPGGGMGRGSSGWAGSGKGSGTASGISGMAGSGKGTGTSRWGRGGSGGSGDGRSGLAAPKYGENPKPFYPMEARDKGYQGDVVVKVEVLPNGQVGEVEVDKSSGYDILDQSAVTTVKKWRFIPARKGGVAIPCWVNIPIKFRLH